MSISTFHPERPDRAEAFVTNAERAMLCFNNRHGAALVAVHGLPRAVAEEVARTFNHAMAEHAVAETEEAEAEAGAAMQAAITARPAE